MEKDYTKIHAAILILSIGLFLFLLTRPRRGAQFSTRTLPGAVMIEVKGDVPEPGIYMLDRLKASVAAAAAVAGCALKIPAALTSKKLASGQSMNVVHQGAGVSVRFGRMPGAALLACGLKLDLNSAPLDELLLIPHMRPKIAASIVERRRRKAWEKIDELMEIRGVGPKTVRKLQDYLEVSR